MIRELNYIIYHYNNKIFHNLNCKIQNPKTIFFSKGNNKFLTPITYQENQKNIGKIYFGWFE